MNRHLRDMLMRPYRDDYNYDNRRGSYDIRGTYDNAGGYYLTRDERNPYGSRGGYVDSTRGRDRGYEDEYDYERDGRRGVRGSGRSMDRDYEEMHYGLDSHFEKMKYLKKHEIDEWMNKMGARWKKEQLMPYIQKENVRFDSEDYNEDEFVAVVNLKYNDYKDILGTSPEIYVKMAKKFFDDKKSMVYGGEKLASLYYALYYDGR